MLIAQDVHERVEREREISQAQERFRRAFEDAPIGMAVADLEGNYLEVNQALCAITGYAANVLCGMRFAAITHPDDLGGDLAAIAALLAGELDTSLSEKRYLRADGAVVWVTRTVTRRARRRRRAAALPRPGPGRHRAPALRARAAPPRRPRPADRPAQPPPLRAGARPPASARSRATARAARCSCSTSTTSSTSTTRSAITPATSSSSRRGDAAQPPARDRHPRAPRRRRVRGAAARTSTRRAREQRRRRARARDPRGGAVTGDANRAPAHHGERRRRAVRAPACRPARSC